jgi:eukaryotic-like serine/threonine-protein kinase
MAQQQRYRVLEKIAAGGMAEVFRAESAGLEGFKKTVAIKRVLPHLSEKKQFIGMFLDEARLSAHLNHSNCVQVFDIGVGDNTYFIVMEYVDGSDLKGLIEYFRKTNQRFPVEEACLITVRICEGLAYAHELHDGNGKSLHIVHRDMSPPNVLITKNGEVKIVDFGLAKANSQLEQSEPGIIKGKFSYLSPEAALGQDVDARTDIFAAGIILWEMLAGRRLFLGETDLETVRQVQRAEIPSIRQLNPKVSAELERVLNRALARDPRTRHQTARELGRDLNEVLFQCGRAVSSFEIGKLVEPIWKERQSKRSQKQDRGSLIGSLIDEALFEFSSVEEDERKSSGPKQTSAAGGGRGFENVQDWADNFSDLSSASLSTGPASAHQYVAGNLSALEDDSPFSTATPGRRPSPESEPPAMEEDEPSAGLAKPSSARAQALEPSAAKGGKGGMIALLVLVVVVAGVLGAYFGGLLPPGLLK